MCHHPDTPGAAQSCCALNRRDKTGLASVQSVWCHLWKVQQSPAGALPRATTLSPVLATSVLNTAPSGALRGTGNGAVISGIPTIPWMDRMEKQPSTTHRRELCPPRALPAAAGGVWGLQGSPSLQPACLSPAPAPAGEAMGLHTAAS